MAVLEPEARDGLGAAVRELRREKGWTQEKLGREAGYRSGAGVSISRLETGLLSPDDERLALLAQALGISIGDLARRAAKAGKSPSPDSPTAVKQRLERVQRELDRRTELATSLSAAFLDAHERANAAFLLPFLTVAGRVESAGRSLPRDDHQPNADELASEAGYGIEFTKFGVARTIAERGVNLTTAPDLADAAAYAAFTAAVAGAAASALGAYPHPSGAVSRGLVRAIGVSWGPMRRRTSPVGALAVGSAVAAGMAAALLAQQRNRKQLQRDISKALDEAEAELAENQLNVDELSALMPEATDLLGYIAVHAGHAFARWEAKLNPERSLSSDERQRFDDFVEIAAAELSVASLDFEELMTLRGDDFQRASALARETLSQAREIVTSRV